MKHSELCEELHAYLDLAGIESTLAQRELLVRHIELVLNANERVNLTRVTDPLEAIRLHTTDSLTALEDLSALPAGRLLDLGSGAGFPGIPLAVCSGRTTVLLDSVGKKVRELELIVTTLGLQKDVTALAGRAEAQARIARGSFSVVTARAVSELPALVELASPLLSQGGALLCFKGAPSADEVDRASAVGSLVGMRLAYQRSFELPAGAGHRTILCYSKIGEAKVDLPRREGLAQHSPLA